MTSVNGPNVRPGTTTSSSSEPEPAGALGAHASSPGSGSCSLSGGTSCRGRWTTGHRTRSSSTESTFRRTRGTTAGATRFNLRSTTSWVAQPSCTAQRSTGSGPRTSVRSTTSTGSRRPGLSATRSSSRTTPRPRGCTRCMELTERTRRRGRIPSPIRRPRSAMSRACRRSPTPWWPRDITRSRRRAESCSTSPTAIGASAFGVPGVTATPAWSTPRPTPRSSPSDPASIRRTSP